MLCVCRHCRKEYTDYKSRAEWHGYCSAKCQHAKAKALGCKDRAKEYQTFKRWGAIGSVPTETEKQKLREELTDLTASLYFNPRRVDELRRLLKAKV